MTGITIYKNHHIALITPQKRVNAQNIALFRQSSNALFQQGVTHFLIDFSQTQVMDSSSIAVLVNIFKRCRQISGSMQLAQTMSPAAHRVLRLTRFDQIFETIEQEEIERILALAASASG